jgi:hypothetical protein
MPVVSLAPEGNGSIAAAMSRTTLVLVTFALAECSPNPKPPCMKPYSCPTPGNGCTAVGDAGACYIDCMPSPSTPRLECMTDCREWISANCPEVEMAD